MITKQLQWHYLPAEMPGEIKTVFVAVRGSKFPKLAYMDNGDWWEVYTEQWVGEVYAWANTKDIIPPVPTVETL